jgi:phage I-like protein
MKGGLPIDFDHATLLAAPGGSPAPAAGWIRDFRIVAGAIEGRVEWPRRGADALGGREYRFISPVFSFERPNGVRDDAMVGRVLLIRGAALTNNPALSQLPALAASRIDEISPMEKKICADMGVSEADYLAQKKKKTQHSPAPKSFRSGQQIEIDRSQAAREMIGHAIARQLGPVLTTLGNAKGESSVALVELTADERKICEAFGNSERDFLALRAKSQKAIKAAWEESAAVLSRFGSSRITVAQLCARSRS